MPFHLLSATTAAPDEGPESLHAGTIRLDGHNVLIAGDAMTVWINPATLMTRHVEIKTTFEGDPLSLTADYRTIVAGPTYQARTTLRYPEDEIEIIAENFDYELIATTH